MNARILFSLLLIVTVVGVGVTGAYAAFSSQASNTGNTFGTGTLNLVINPGASPFPSPIFTVADAKPGDVFDQEIVLANTGSIPAGSVQTTLPSLSGNSELASVLTIRYYDDSTGSVAGSFDAGDTILGTEHLDNAVWNGYTLPGISISAGGSKAIRALLTFDAGADSTYQGKSMTFSLGFQANQ